MKKQIALATITIVALAVFACGQTNLGPIKTSSITLTGKSDGCLNVAAGIIGSTGSPCGSGGGGGGGLQAPLVGGVQTAGIVVANASNNNTTPAGQADIFAAIGYTAANDAAVVHTSGTETIAGLKTFTSAITFNSDVNVLGNFNLAAAGPILFSGVGQTGTPTCKAGTDFCIFLNLTTHAFSCLLTAGGNCNFGPAGGDLCSGSTLPNPNVCGINGTLVDANWQLMGTNSSKQPQVATAHAVAATLSCPAASASGTAYTCTTSPTFTPATNDSVKFIADVANTGAATLNVNGTTADAITKQGASATPLIANDLRAGQTTILTLDAAGHWEMQGQLGNAPSGSGTVNNSTYTGCPGVYLFSSTTTIDCANVANDFIAMGNGTTVPLTMFTQTTGSGTFHAYAPFGTESLVISSQAPANDVFSVASCIGTSCTPTRDMQVDSTGIVHINQGLQMAGNTKIQGSASSVSLNLSCGSDSNATQACTATLRGGDVTGNGTPFNGGAVLIRGGNINGTGASDGAGNLNIAPGALINASPGAGATEGTIDFDGGVYLSSGTISLGSLACFVGSKLIGNCPTVAANQQLLGIVDQNVGASYYVQNLGTYTNLPLDGTYTFAAGDSVCPSTTVAGAAMMATTGANPCPAAQIGTAINSASAVTTVTTFLAISHGVAAVKKVASGTIALHTAAIASTACDVTTATATGALSTDVLKVSANADISGVTGYIPSTSGTLSIYPPWLTSNTVNVKVCNNTAGSLTPGAVTLNFMVER